MKYQKQLAIVGAVALAAGAIWYLRRTLSENPSDVRGVTSVTKSGATGEITTTPLKLGNLAYVAASSTLDTLATARDRITGLIRGFIPASTDKLQPYGNTQSATAAYYTNRNTRAANYAPSAYAIIE